MKSNQIRKLVERFWKFHLTISIYWLQLSFVQQNVEMFLNGWKSSWQLTIRELSYRLWKVIKARFTSKQNSLKFWLSKFFYSNAQFHCNKNWEIARKPKIILKLKLSKLGKPSSSHHYICRFCFICWMRCKNSTYKDGAFKTSCIM